MTVRRPLALVTMLVCALLAWLGGFFVFVGLWAVIASEGEPDPDFSWRSYAETMAISATVCLVFGGIALLFYVRRIRRRPQT